jgi:hypothetical protein
MSKVNVLLNPQICYNCHVTYKLSCVLSDLMHFLHNGMAEICTLLNALNSVDILEVQLQFVALYCHSKIFMAILPSFLARM